MTEEKKYNMLAILGPTASGKAAVAAHVVKLLGEEGISADYRRMDLGTRKDYVDYEISTGSTDICLLTKRSLTSGNGWDDNEHRELRYPFS